MKRFILLLLITAALLFACSCRKKETSGNQKTVPAKEVTVLTDDSGSVNGYRQEGYQSFEGSKPSQSGTVYYANTSSKKFHTEDCRYAKTISKENLLTDTNRAKLVSEGYAPCQNCNP